MKKLIVILIPFLVILVLSPTVTNAVLTKVIKEKLPDYIPIEELKCEIHSNTLTISGKLYGKLPTKTTFNLKLSFSEITLTPQKVFLNDKEIPFFNFVEEIRLPLTKIFL